MNITNSMRRVMAPTIQHESGGDPAAWNPDDPKGSGLVSIGLFQFHQRGGLPAVLRRMRDEAPGVFSALAGNDIPVVLDHPGMIESMKLRPYKRSLQAIFRELPEVQMREAWASYFAPAIEVGRFHGLTSERAASLLGDAAIQRGGGWVRAQLMDIGSGIHDIEGQPHHSAVEQSILQILSDNADRGYGGRESGRRNRILRDPALSDDPFDPAAPAPPAPAPPARPTLRRRDRGSAVEELRGQLHVLGYLDGWAADVPFGPKTEAAVRAFQAAHGIEVDGICGPITWAALGAAMRGDQSND